MPDFRVGDVRISYQFDVAGGSTIVLLNGIAMSMGHWKPLMKALGGMRGFLCHDFRGQSLSDKPAGPYSFDLHARDLKALLEGLGIGKAHIVGTSYGSEVAMAFASTYPEACSSLCLIDGVSELDPVLESAAESWKAAALADPRAFYKTLLPWTYSNAYLAANRDALKAREDAIAALPPEWFRGFAALCDAFLAIDLTPRLGSISCPTLVMVGDEDILKPEKFSRIMAREIPHARLEIIEGAGHASVIEMPGRVASSLATFLEEVE
ncbi:MAG TPA: alpha/beta fold hydrolase [Rectinemataceae bacterium]